MGKDLIRVPRVLGESYNSALIERLYSTGGSVMLDLIIYLGSYYMRDLFGEYWFSVADFCKRMGYTQSNLQRRLTQAQLTELFGSKVPPTYMTTDGNGRTINHPIETIFEAALYKLGLENISYPATGNDGATSYHFVQILKRFDIKTDFTTKKSTKRLYSAVLSPEIKDLMFSLYNLLELSDYRNLPSKYRYFYLEISKMIYLIKYKIRNNEPPFYALTVDQLAKKFNVQIQDTKDRKKKVAIILRTMNKYLQYTNFNFSFVKGKNEKWAYTVMFSFPEETLEYFNEGEIASVTKKFYRNLLWLYAEVSHPDIPVSERNTLVKEIEDDGDLYGEFLLWANSSEDSQKKKDLYINDFIAVCGRRPGEMPNAKSDNA